MGISLEFEDSPKNKFSLALVFKHGYNNEMLGYFIDSLKAVSLRSSEVITIRSSRSHLLPIN